MRTFVVGVALGKTVAELATVVAGKVLVAKLERSLR